jgi:hypothetical protein
LLMPSRPLVLDSIYEGVSSCSLQQQEMAQPSKGGDSIFGYLLVDWHERWQRGRSRISMCRDSLHTNRSALGHPRCYTLGMHARSSIVLGAYHPVRPYCAIAE